MSDQQEKKGEPPSRGRPPDYEIAVPLEETAGRRYRGQKRHWLRIGVAWKHLEQDRIDLWFDAMPLSNRVYLYPYNNENRVRTRRDDTEAPSTTTGEDRDEKNDRDR